MQPNILNGGFGDAYMQPNIRNGGNVTIAYKLNKNENGVVILYDILGREQMKIELHPDNNKVSINVSLLSQGLYTYRYLVNNRQQYADKLLIE